LAEPVPGDTLRPVSLRDEDPFVSAGPVPVAPPDIPRVEDGELVVSPDPPCLPLRAADSHLASALPVMPAQLLVLVPTVPLRMPALVVPVAGGLWVEPVVDCA
jgi:hypothetical protein